MSKNISVSDEVYEKLKREKGDRSFTEVIAEKLEAGGNLEAVAGQEIFDPETVEDVKGRIREHSEGTRERLDS